MVYVMDAGQYRRMLTLQTKKNPDDITGKCIRIKPVGGGVFKMWTTEQCKNPFGGDPKVVDFNFPRRLVYLEEFLSTFMMILLSKMLAKQQKEL